MSRAVLDALVAMRVQYTVEGGPLRGISFRHSLHDDQETVTPPIGVGCPMPAARSEIGLTQLGPFSIHRVNQEFTAVEIITLALLDSTGNAPASLIIETMTPLLQSRDFSLVEGGLWRARIRGHQRLSAVIQSADKGNIDDTPGGSRQVVFTWTGRTSYREVG